MSYDPLISSGVASNATQPDTYWRTTVDAPPHQTLNQDISTDVVVIGAGYTGLNAAWHLSQQGVDCVLLDASAPGFGCAGRNGGFVLSGTGRLGLPQLAERYSETVARGMQCEFAEAVELVTARISDEHIDCDLVSGPYYKLAYSGKHAHKLQQSVITLNDSYGGNATYLDHTSLRKQLGVHRAFGASVQEGLALNPLKLSYGYLQSLRQAGCPVYHHSPVTSLTKQGSDYTLQTPAASIRANRVLIASNAYSPRQLHDAVDNRQFPVQSSILVTNPLSDAQAEVCGLTRPMTMMDTRMMKYYYRVLPDGRLLFGGRGEVAGKGHDSFQAKRRLYKALQRSFPALAGLGIAHFWSGWVSVSYDDLPRVRYDAQNKIGYAMGYCGSGVSFAALAGKRLAQQVLGESIDRSLPIYADDLPRFPLPQFRRLALRGLYTWAAISKR